MDYSSYQALAITRRGPDNTVLDIQMRALNGKLPTAGHAGHAELAQIWRDVSADDSVRCAVLRGEGQGFSGGGDLSLVEDMATDFEVRTRVWKEARDLVYNVINCDKPIVSACTARQSPDWWRELPSTGHHPPRPRQHLLLCEAVSGEEAERIGLVSLAVEEDQCCPRLDCRQAGAGHPLDQVFAEQLAATGRAGFRREGGPGLAARAPRPEILTLWDNRGPSAATAPN